MKNTAPPYIRTLYTFLFLALCIACNSPSSGEKDKKTDSIKEKKASFVAKNKSKNQNLVPLTDDNLEKELLAYGVENPETLVLLKTPKGNMKIILYENTPLHRANFIRLVKNNFYKDTEFYRVVKDFMIQGGDNDDWSRQTIKNKMGTYTIPAEFRSENIHKKGALSMAREYENNPDKRSVSFEWFIVEGTTYNEGQILGAEKYYDIKILPQHKETYKTVGGTPHLDGNHTVFGQVIEGLNVIDSIASVKVDEGDWPIENISIEFQILE